MAYTPLTDAEIEVGKPTKKELFTKVKSNQDSFNTDIENLKQTSVIQIFNFKAVGDINGYSTTDIDKMMPTFKAPVDGTIVSFVSTLLTVSTSGNLDIEIEKSTDDGVTWTQLLSSPVQLSGTTVGSKSGTVNWVDPASQDFNQGDLLRLKVSTIQVDQGDFQLLIYGELA